MDSMPRVTTNDGTPTYATITPLKPPTSRAVPSASGTASQNGVPTFIDMPITMPDRASTAPTDRSMPPVTITAVIPSAMIPTNAKFRVTLNRFCCVAKTSLATDRTRKASTAASDTQNVWRLRSQLSTLSCVCRPIDSSSVIATSGCLARRLPTRASGGVDGARDEPGDLFGRARGDGLVRHLLSPPQHDDPVGHGKDVRHAVADEDDGDTVVAQPTDEVEDLGDLPHADGSRRLVHQHDARVRQARAGDGDGLPLTARHAPDEVSRS